jgi:hypothetical protein
MEARGSRHPVVGWVLLTVLLLSTIVVFHKDIEFVYSPSCPACQLESNPGSHTSAISVTSLIPSPVMLSFVPARNELVLQQIHRTLEFIPRSPPAGF